MTFYIDKKSLIIKHCFISSNSSRQYNKNRNRKLQTSPLIHPKSSRQPNKESNQKSWTSPLIQSYANPRRHPYQEISIPCERFTSPGPTYLYVVVRTSKTDIIITINISDHNRRYILIVFITVYSFLVVLRTPCSTRPRVRPQISTEGQNSAETRLTNQNPVSCSELSHPPNPTESRQIPFDLHSVATEVIDPSEVSVLFMSFVFSHSTL